jgi:type IX secretion system PorP/SprF family membrane protein
MKTNLLLFASLFFLQSNAQQDVQSTQYMYNTILVNPAYAGTREAMSIFISNRSQWIGLDGAPQTNSISMNTPITRNLGIGLSVLNDKIGCSDENNIAADISYSIPTSEIYELSFGVKASVNLLNIDFNKLNLGENKDFVFQNNITNELSPNIGVGLYYHSDISYIGVSAPNLLETIEYKSSKVSYKKTHYYLIAGHVFDLNDRAKFKPSLQVKYVKGAPLEVDLSANFMINDKFTTGVAYRYNSSASVLFGLQVSESLFVGYSYDINTNNLAQYNSGSHEVFLRFEILKTVSRVVAPTFF